ncbi:GNAT family N-acetyltransferase [Bacillus sp. FSL K6-3431]|uniref:GNAT family N-acetyltransferase n=1 Tax=Bacillus sp. FSL K6-3431 TaxID=2921500 RepID=UPI0030FB9414
MLLFEKDSIIVRELERSDDVLLAKWLSDPEILEYYEGRDNAFDIYKVMKTFFNEEDINRSIIEFEGVAIGYIQFYLLDEKTMEVYDYPIDEKVVIFGMDQFIGEVNYWNRGIGQALIHSMVNYLIGQKQSIKIVMDPQTWNDRAIHCYEKCGFQKVKLLPKHELHEGEYRDCWLMEYTKNGV